MTCQCRFNCNKYTTLVRDVDSESGLHMYALGGELLSDELRWGRGQGHSAPVRRSCLVGKHGGVGNSQRLDDPESILWNWGQRAGASEPCVAAGELTSSLPIPGPGLIP